jgi:hypothetical protein
LTAARLIGTGVQWTLRADCADGQCD